MTSKEIEAQADAVLKVMEINAKYGTALDTKIIDALLERDKEVIRQRAKIKSKWTYNKRSDNPREM